MPDRSPTPPAAAREAKRAPVRDVWLDIVIRHHNAARAKDEPLREKLFDLSEALRDVYPEEIAMEEMLWSGERQ